MIQLLSYQQRALEAVQACGASRPIIVSPTGTGKTITGLAVTATVGSHLWLAHRKELVDQATKSAERMGIALRASTVQGLLASGEYPPVDLLIVDECHHLAADTWSTIADHYPRILGLSATPERGPQGDGLGAIFNHIVVATTIKEAIELGRLVPCSVVAPPKPLKGGQIAQHPVKAYRQHADGRKAVVFAPNVASAMQFASEFSTAGVPACYVHAGMSASVRDAAFADYAAGKYKILCNVAIATEGWDDPETSAVIIARGCGTPGLYIQMVGRGLRCAPGKTDCIVLDLRGVSHVHGDPLEDRLYSLEGRGIRRKGETVQATYCAICGCPKTTPMCADCGFETEPAAPPRVMNCKLVPRIYLPGATVEAKKAKWKQIQAEAKAKGYKPGWAYMRYKLLFGHPPR